MQTLLCALQVQRQRNTKVLRRQGAWPMLDRPILLIGGSDVHAQCLMQIHCTEMRMGMARTA